MEEVRIKPIAPELRKLKLGESITFPIEQQGSVRAVISRLKREMMRKHWNARAITNTNKYEVVVSRIS